MGAQPYPNPQNIYAALFLLPPSVWQPVIEQDLSTDFAEKSYYISSLASALSGWNGSDSAQKALIQRLWQDFGYLQKENAQQLWAVDPTTCLNIIRMRCTGNLVTPETQNWPVVLAKELITDDALFRQEMPYLLQLAPTGQLWELTYLMKKHLGSAALPLVLDQVIQAQDCSRLTIFLQTWKALTPQTFSIEAGELLMTYSAQWDREEQGTKECFAEYLKQSAN
ncbi:MAG: hypothetical protein H6510_02780 [Acidobacteria bacterium]|nr:hypothetical protein [Acidobacteriota bacterium]MCB9396721.1 hypothetical protein [Acidobacteriota bacterium]